MIVLALHSSISRSKFNTYKTGKLQTQIVTCFYAINWYMHLTV